MTDEKYVAALEAIYDAAVDPEKWPAALEAISIFCGARMANLFYIGEDGAFRLIVSENFPLNMLNDYHDNWWKFDIRTHRAVEQEYVHWRGAQTDLDLVTQNEVDASPFYQEYLRSHDLCWIVAMGVSPVPNARVAITVQFSLSHKAVTDDDRRRLERIAPHVESALRLSLRLQANDVLRDGLANALTRLDVGVLVLDPAGFVTFANPIAIDLLGEMGTVIGKAPRFGAGNVQKIVQKEIEKRLDPQLNYDASPPILLPDSDGMAKAAMYFLPVGASAQSNSSSLLDPSHIILIIGMHNSAPPDSALVRDILGVTLGEARVAALIGSGMAPKEAAEKLGITVETVRTVLKNVSAKVGIKKQSELTALLTRLVLR